MKQSGALKLVLLSDTHQLHSELTMPLGDVLLFAGDMLHFGGSAASLASFDDWLSELPYAHKIVTPGNHDGFFESSLRSGRSLRNAVVLIDEAVNICGLKVWGSPVTPLAQGAFGMPSARDRERLYAAIPDNTDILLTHMPPYGVLDSSPDCDEYFGCPQLLAAVTRVRPLLHVFGHVHSGHGIVQGETTFVNAAVLGEDGGASRGPVVLNLPRT